jgi:hypothetical protein
MVCIADLIVYWQEVGMISDNVEIRTCWGCGKQFLVNKTTKQRYHSLFCFKDTVTAAKKEGNGTWGNRIEKFYR